MPSRVPQTPSVPVQKTEKAPPEPRISSPGRGAWTPSPPPPPPEDAEHRAFELHQREAADLKLKEKHGTIVPAEQERLGVLQAKMNDFWTGKIDRAARFGHDLTRKPGPEEESEDGSPEVVQRKVGFEFEASLWKVKPYSKGQQFDDKAKLYESGNAEVQRDSGNLEFVTKPKDSWGGVQESLQEILNLVHTFRTQKKATTGYGPEINPIWKRYFKVTRESSTIKAKPQASLGVPLSKVQDLIQEQGRTQPRENEPLQKLAEASPNAAGLMSLVLEYLDIGKKARAQMDKQGPKVKFPVMARTDFHSMYNSLSRKEQGVFRNEIGAKGRNIDPSALAQKLHHYGVEEEAPSVDDPEAGTDSPVYKGKVENEPAPTVKEWLASILSGSNSGKDELSPPPGYASHSEARRQGKAGYGMGAYGMDPDDDKLAIFELREAWEKQNEELDSDKWLEWAAQFLGGLVGKGILPKAYSPQKGGGVGSSASVGGGQEAEEDENEEDEKEKEVDEKESSREDQDEDQSESDEESDALPEASGEKDMPQADWTQLEDFLTSRRRRRLRLRVPEMEAVKAAYPTPEALLEAARNDALTVPGVISKDRGKRISASIVNGFLKG